MAKLNYDKFKERLKKATHETTSYKGISIQKTTAPGLAPFYVCNVDRFKHHRSLESIKKVINAWEKKQYKKDKK